jgi:hypothetical protein
VHDCEKLNFVPRDTENTRVAKFPEFHVTSPTLETVVNERLISHPDDGFFQRLLEQGSLKGIIDEISDRAALENTNIRTLTILS